MPYILTRRVRTSQPQQAVRASAAFELNKSLVSFIHGEQLQDINGPGGSGTAVGLVNATLTDGVGSKLNGSDTSNYYDYSSSLFYQSGSDNTVVFGVIFNSYQSGFIIYEAGTGHNNYGVMSPASSSSSVIANYNSNSSNLTTKNDFELGRLYKFCITCNASQASIYIDGALDSTHTISLPFSYATAVTTLGRHKQSNGSSGLPTLSTLQYVGIFNVTATDEVARQLSINPWQLLEDEEDYIWVPEAGGGVSNIAASGTVQVGGTASPVVAVAMSGVGASLSSGTAADRVTVNIGAAGLATAAATAGISAQVLLAGAAAALASGNATLAATLNALASGAAQASGTATINSGVAGALAAVGTDVVSGSAPIRVTVSLGASGSDAVGGSAAIVGSPISSPLSGAGVDVVSGSGAAVINVSLSAAGFVQAMAAGQLSMQVRLSSTGASVVSGVAGITSLGVTVDAPNGYGPKIIRPKTRRPANLGGIIF